MYEVNTQTTDPRQIYQEHVDFLSDSLLANDFEGFASRISFPHHIQNVNAAFVSENLADLRRLFDQMHESLVLDRVTTIVRFCTQASFVQTDEIVGEHVSEILRGATRAVRPYRNRLRLIRSRDGVWRETNSANAISVKSGQMGLYTQSDQEEQVPDFGRHHKD